MSEAIGIIRLGTVAEVGANTLSHKGIRPAHSDRRCCEFHGGSAGGENRFAAGLRGIAIALACLKYFNLFRKTNEGQVR